MQDDSRDIEAYLRAHPGFLAERPELYRALEPPLRVHGQVLADHMEAMVRRERAHAASMQSHADTVLAAGRAAAGMMERVQEAVLGAIAAADLPEWVTHELPQILGLDAAALCAERFRPSWRALPPGAVAMLLGGRPAVFRDRPADAVLLHAEAAQLAERDVLVRVPCPFPALLALVSRDAGTLPGPAAAAPLAFLGRVLGGLACA